jgi:hypothetical protein
MQSGQHNVSLIRSFVNPSRVAGGASANGPLD